MLKLTSAIIIGKLTRTICHLIPSLGGTALPGLIALKLNKNLIKNLVNKNNLKSIIITGTNGKTTTGRLLAHILKKANISYLHNRTGSNLERGIASNLISNSSMKGSLPSQLAIFEIDEAVVPLLSKVLNPKVILFTNLFRDQLDRYGEIDTILSKWKQTLKTLNNKTTIIYNCDDPSLEYLTKETTNKISFGLNKSHSTTKPLSASADAIFCLNCHQPLNFTHIFTSHLGHYSCPSCNFKRSVPKVNLNLKSNLPGIYNLYNLLAAIAIAKSLGINQKTITKAIKSFTPTFGRGKSFKLKNLKTKILLVKNPTGYNVILETLTQNKNFKTSPLLLILNDNIADGTDISWIWDVHFNYLKYQKAPIIVSGTRANDLKLRLKYAGIQPARTVLAGSIKKALKILSNQPGSSAYILPTYTALLKLRKILKS
ncbi:MAG: MurT ligase domain-containing protein [Candidatus Beckwithbacteria bacterium]|nr:DUF1727 domain-containing protein [Patescibacteria group bacterium]